MDEDTFEIGHNWLIILILRKIDTFSEWSPGNRVGTVELVEGGALDAGDGGEGGGQHCQEAGDGGDGGEGGGKHRHQKKKQHFPEKQHINHGKATVLGKASGVFATVSKLKICL